jgi:hypothetical protein
MTQEERDLVWREALLRAIVIVQRTRTKTGGGFG